MLEAVYEWIKNLSFYLVIVTAVLEVLPGDSYRKYIRFYIGIVLILLVVTPLLQVTGTISTFQMKYKNYESELMQQEILESREYFEASDLFASMPKETQGDTDLQINSESKSEIRVEEIEIGKNQKSDFDMASRRGEASEKTTASGASVDRAFAAGNRDSDSGRK